MTSRPFNTTQSALVTAAVAAALGTTAGNVQAAAVTGITLQDVGSNTANAAGAYSSTLDGISGAFRFNNSPIDVSNYTGAHGFFTGDVGTGTILGEGAANPTGSFSTGFLLSSAPFVPFTFGNGLVADITAGALTVTSIDLGGNFGGGTSFFLPPDANTLEVLWVNARGNGIDFDVAFRFTHDITSGEDPTLNFRGFTAQWVIEGCATTAAGGTCASVVPVPAAAWLFGSGLVGLAGVARRRSKTSNNEDAMKT